MEKVVSLARRRGFVFPSSEIYGGLGSSYDYGHYGVLLKDNVKARWLEAMVRERDDIVALDSSIILHPKVWEASGHVAGFTDPLVDCRTCKKRFRADQIAEAQCGRKPSKHPGETPDCDLTEPRQFNLMFRTRVGAVEETGLDVYLRPETAQGIFVNFKNVAQLARRKPPFGIAQVVKAFRNEITPGNFIFRTLEFEMMELEYFVPPAESADWHAYWVAERLAWHVRYGVLLKDNVKARWLEAMVRERDDIVALDSSIILHPRVWEASGHVAGFADPLVDCRTCKQRFRADHLDTEQCGQRPSKKPGETENCDLTEPRNFNLMFQTLSLIHI